MTELLDFLDKTYGDSKAVDLVLYPPVLHDKAVTAVESQEDEEEDFFQGRVADVSGSLNRINSQYSGDNQREVSPSHYSGADPPALGKF